MTVEDPAVVDIVGFAPNRDLVALTIADHLEWGDSHQHLTILQAKLNRYLAFIESGELLRKFPDAEGLPVRIDVVFKYPPSREGEGFLKEADAIIVKAGFAFSWRVPAA